MITKRDSNERGPTNISWLNSMHTFSFGHYYDPKHMGYGHLRVINDDRVIAGAGFETHPHKNMEIISYVLEGEMAHKDSMGNGSIIKRGEVQIMSAGTGVTHSEYNHSQEKPLHFLQIWIVPNIQNTEPSYHQKHFDKNEMKNHFKLVVSPTGEGGSLPIKQEAKLLIAHFEKGSDYNYDLNPSKKYWLHVAQGDSEINHTPAQDGDSFAIEDESILNITTETPSEMLLFELEK